MCISPSLLFITQDIIPQVLSLYFKEGFFAGGGEVKIMLHILAFIERRKTKEGNMIEYSSQILRRVCGPAEPC